MPVRDSGSLSRAAVRCVVSSLRLMKKKDDCQERGEPVAIGEVHLMQVVCVRVREKQRESVCACDRESVCVRERERGRESASVCVCEMIAKSEGKCT